MRKVLSFSFLLYDNRQACASSMRFVTNLDTVTQREVGGWQKQVKWNANKLIGYQGMKMQPRKDRLFSITTGVSQINMFGRTDGDPNIAIFINKLTEFLNQIQHIVPYAELKVLSEEIISRHWEENVPSQQPNPNRSHKQIVYWENLWLCWIFSPPNPWQLVDI